MSGASDDGTISYNYSQCQEIYEDLERDQATISTQIKALENTIITLLMRSWRGLSASQWQHTQSQWDAAVGTMLLDLKKMAALLPEMTSTMQYADKQAADRIAGIM